MKQRSSMKAVSAKEWRRRRQQRARGRAVPLTLPNGLAIMISRPPIETWFGTSKLPERLSRNVINVFDVQMDDPDLQKKVDEKMAAMPPEESAELVRFFNRLLLEGVVEPMLVDKDPDDCTDDEYALSDLDEEERATIIYTLMQGVPDQLVQTEHGGEVSMQGLDRFRDQPGGAPAGEAG